MGISCSCLLFTPIVPPVLDGPQRESVNYTLGSHVALLCEATGVPVPSITWLKDGTPIGKRKAVMGKNRKVTNYPYVTAKLS